MANLKVVILIPVYKRPEIFEICARNIRLFSLFVEWDVKVVCVLSPEDKHLKENQNICGLHEFCQVYYHNEPVSNKMNAGIQWIMDNLEFDYLMNMGSDDLIHPDIEALYGDFIRRNSVFFGINTLYFYDFPTQKAIFFDTYNTNGAIGAGRMIHYSLLKWFHDNQMPLYEPGLSCGLDTSSAMSIKRLGYYEIIADSGEFPYIVDIKSDTNINLYEHLEQRTKNCRPVDPSVITNQFKL